MIRTIAVHELGLSLPVEFGTAPSTLLCVPALVTPYLQSAVVADAQVPSDRLEAASREERGSGCEEQAVKGILKRDQSLNSDNLCLSRWSCPYCSRDRSLSFIYRCIRYDACCHSGIVGQFVDRPQTQLPTLPLHPVHLFPDLPPPARFTSHRPLPRELQFERVQPLSNDHNTVQRFPKLFF